MCNVISHHPATCSFQSWLEVCHKSLGSCKPKAMLTHSAMGCRTALHTGKNYLNLHSLRIKKPNKNPKPRNCSLGDHRRSIWSVFIPVPRDWNCWKYYGKKLQKSQTINWISSKLPALRHMTWKGQLQNLSFVSHQLGHLKVKQTHNPQVSATTSKRDFTVAT